MADFSPPTQKQDNGKRKTKKLSTRVDLTPMVDLGFLLITFFTFTTSMTEPKSLKLAMPDDRPTPDSTKYPESAIIQIILDNHDRVWYYNGSDINNIRKTYFGNELRKVIINKRNSVRLKLGRKEDTSLIIKPTKNCSLKNIVDIMDEVLINDIKHYAITEPNEADLKKIQETF